MKIRVNHPVVRFAYLFQGQEPPERYDYTRQRYGPKPTSLCPLFWRCVLNAIVLVVPTLLACVGLFYLGRFIWHYWKDVLIGIAVTVAWMSALTGIVYAFASDGLDWGQKCLDGLSTAADVVIVKPIDAAADSVVWEMIKAVKAKVCPIVTFVQE